MKPLIVLISVFVLALLVLRIGFGDCNLALAARIAMAAMLVFTAIGHFSFGKGMAMMLPASVPFRTTIVYITGVIEIAAAIGLVIPGFTTLTGWLLIVFFILILPANISAAIRGIDYQKGTSDGPGLRYLWFRVPLQLLFIIWTYLSCLA
ncbi:hypothetical protein MUY27_12405 [Mucilaginibacter sp. RS28]|uniref:DoxX family membrane protein n=1 Tax=Mucilaginibacter straminoryzae TaxID=2932774 RepID=A0A9X2B9J2_9SPHI|nr:hypothetical protein [Mucilaginibacter straminoryzae]MCJ8210511.1 hypothetical protein [Mucilaginibacter straminoryzae]